MRQTCKLILVAFATIAGITSRPASAQEATGFGQPQFFVTPYLWLAGVYATTQTPLDRVPTVNSSVGPFEMLGHLEGAPFMGSAEIRDGPIGLLGDVLHVPVSTKVTTRNVFFQGGNVALATNTGTALVVYRVLSAPNQFADFGGGFRAWGFSANISLNPGLHPGDQEIAEREDSAQRFYGIAPAEDEGRVLAQLRAVEPSNAETLAAALDRERSLRASYDRIESSPDLSRPIVAAKDVAGDETGPRRQIAETVFDSFTPQLDLSFAAAVYGLAGLFLGSLVGELVAAALLSRHRLAG
jgi:hypothetical protein